MQCYVIIKNSNIKHNVLKSFSYHLTDSHHWCFKNIIEWRMCRWQGQALHLNDQPGSYNMKEETMQVIRSQVYQDLSSNIHVLLGFHHLCRITCITFGIRSEVMGLTPLEKSTHNWCISNLFCSFIQGHDPHAVKLSIMEGRFAWTRRNQGVG